MKTILLADDDENLRALFQLMLEGEGYRVLSAPDGKVAWEMARQEKPDLVFLDIMMPEMHGYSVCHNIKSDPALKHIKVVMLSSKSFIADHRQAEQVGADGFLSKPVMQEQLVAAVKQYLGK